jgi:hypothetical protein
MHRPTAPTDQRAGFYSPATRIQSPQLFIFGTTQTQCLNSTNDAELPITVCDIAKTNIFTAYQEPVIGEC